MYKLSRILNAVAYLALAVFFAFCTLGLAEWQPAEESIAQSWAYWYLFAMSCLLTLVSLFCAHDEIT